MVIIHVWPSLYPISLYQGLRYRLIPMFWPDIKTVDMTRYRRNGTRCLLIQWDETAINGQFCRFRYQNPMVHTKYRDLKPWFIFVDQSWRYDMLLFEPNVFGLDSRMNNTSQTQCDLLSLSFLSLIRHRRTFRLTINMME